jgi:16S rRNA U516 pseudouridylate synthase RsuA-like enzyme
MTADMAIRKFLKHVGVTSQREIESLVRTGEVMGGKLKLRMTPSAEGTLLKHVYACPVRLRQAERGR